MGLFGREKDKREEQKEDKEKREIREREVKRFLLSPIERDTLRGSRIRYEI